MRAVKIQRLLPAKVSIQEVRRWVGNDYKVLQVDEKPANFVIYGKTKQDVDVLKGVIRSIASKKNFLLISGPDGIGKNEVFGRPYFQFAFKQRPSKRPGPGANSPQAKPSQPSAPLVNSSNPIPPIQQVQSNPLKKPQQRYQQPNRLGWTKDGYTQFYAMTKPGGDWTTLKKGLDSSNIPVTERMIELFSGKAKYGPLVGLFKELGNLIAHNDGPGYRKMINRIQPRLERLYNFARTEALAKSIVIKSLSRKLI